LDEISEMSYAQWYMRVQRVKIKVYKKPLFHAVLS